jgi:hypothetical protein
MQNCLGSSSAPRWFTGPCKEQHGRQTAPLSYRTKHTFPALAVARTYRFQNRIERFQNLPIRALRAEWGVSVLDLDNDCSFQKGYPATAG